MRLGLVYRQLLPLQLLFLFSLLFLVCVARTIMQALDVRVVMR
jgi:hypothetical protein